MISISFQLITFTTYTHLGCSSNSSTLQPTCLSSHTIICPSRQLYAAICELFSQHFIRDHSTKMPKSMQHDATFKRLHQPLQALYRLSTITFKKSRLCLHLKEYQEFSTQQVSTWDAIFCLNLLMEHVRNKNQLTINLSMPIVSSTSFPTFRNLKAWCNHGAPRPKRDVLLCFEAFGCPWWRRSTPHFEHKTQGETHEKPERESIRTAWQRLPGHHHEES